MKCHRITKSMKSCECKPGLTQVQRHTSSLSSGLHWQLHQRYHNDSGSGCGHKTKWKNPVYNVSGPPNFRMINLQKKRPNNCLQVYLSLQTSLVKDHPDHAIPTSKPNNPHRCMSNDFMEQRDKLVVYPHREEDKRHYNKDWYRWSCHKWNYLWFSAKENSWWLLHKVAQTIHIIQKP